MLTAFNLYVALLSLPALIAAYYAFGMPSWTKEFQLSLRFGAIRWSTRTTLFAIEGVSILLLMFVHVYAQASGQGRDFGLYSQAPVLLDLLAILVALVVLSYNMSKVIIENEAFLPRLFYAAFSFLMLQEIFYVSHLVTFGYLSPLLNDLSRVTFNNLNVFSYGEHVIQEQTKIAVISLILGASLLLWSLSLLSASLNPKSITLSVAAGLAALAAVTTMLVHHQVDEALARNLAPIERAITREIAAIPKSADDVTRVTGLITLRESVKGAFGVPVIAFVFGAVQCLAAVAGVAGPRVARR